MKKYVKSICRQPRATKVGEVFLVLLFLFFMSLALAPMHKMQELKELVYSDSLFIEKYDSLYSYPQMSQLVKEKGYKEALLALSGSDSIQMMLNLADSTVSLLFKGVRIHHTPVEVVEKDRLLERMPLIQQVRLFSHPLLVQSQDATIVKEPVVVRYAPKDTLEAPRNAWQPDTLVQNPAFALFSLEQDIRVIIEQDQNVTFSDKWARFFFINRLRWNDSVQALSCFVRLKNQVFHPEIIIKMPAQDLRAIYRAMPNKAYMVVNL